MQAIIQDHRPVKVYSALADNTLVFCSLTGSERISQLYNYEVEVASEDLSIDLERLTGTDITIELELPHGAHRFYHGIISECSQVEGSEEYAKYHLTVRPWAWLLTRTSDCKIFQNKSVPDIITQIFNEEGFSDYLINLTGHYAPTDYCVQYRETDFNFISRLMEQEGIYYYFKHENGAHKLVLSDSLASHNTFDHYAEVPYYPVTSEQIRERDHLSTWQLTQNLKSGAYATNDFNFEDPGSDLLVRKEAPGNHLNANFEVFDYPGEYPVRSAGEQVANFRIEEIQAQQNLIVASGNAEGLSAGHLFSLRLAEREDQNREHLIIESSSHFQRENFRSSGSSSIDTDFHCHISAIPSNQPYRAPRLTPKPIVQGCQTAIVVGKAGEEIWTDEHGRVKLQFHWDRYGNSDENSSCWVRVSQVHAGAGFGAIDVPRIGEEVIVEYLNGDPDRPIVTGRVYNGKNKTPTDLPAKRMVSGIKTNSTPGGGGHNQVTHDDTKGAELMDIHAQRDRASKVLNDDTLNVGANRRVVIKDNFDTTITDGNMMHDVANGTAHIHIQGAVTENFDSSQTTTVAKDITVTSSEGMVSVQAASAITLKTGESSITMDAEGNIAITGINVTIAGAMTVTTTGEAVVSEGTLTHTTLGETVLSDGSLTNTVTGTDVNVG